jgi:hypothetical protein
MNSDSHLLFEAYINPPSKNIKDGKGKTITIGDFVSLIDEPEAVGEVREVLADGNLIIVHSGDQWEEISPSDVELRVEEDAQEEDTEEHDDGDQPESDVDALYTIIENALSNQDIDNQRQDAILTASYFNKKYNIVVTPA